MSRHYLIKCPACGAVMHRSQVVCRACVAKLPAAMQAAVKSARTASERTQSGRAAVAQLTGQPELKL